MPGFLHDLLIDVALTTPLVGAYILFALGVVFIFRASRVLNLAHGAMAMVPAYVAFSVAQVTGVVGGFVAALAVGAALGLTVERVVVRRLRSAPIISQTVGTVGVLGMLIALAVRLWGTTPRNEPSIFPAHAFKVGSVQLTLGDIGLLVVALILSALFLALFKFTDLGLDMRCAAENRRAARLMGIDPDRTTMIAWLFAGVLAATGGALLASSTTLHPYTLSLQVLPAFVAALIGGLDSVPGAVVGSVVVGLTLGIVPSLGGIGSQAGAPEVALAAVGFVVMGLRGRRFSVAGAA
jgi:branched-chain amino acid transport system permease protein